MEASKEVRDRLSSRKYNDIELTVADSRNKAEIKVDDMALTYIWFLNHFSITYIALRGLFNV